MPFVSKGGYLYRLIFLLGLSVFKSVTQSKIPNGMRYKGVTQ